MKKIKFLGVLLLITIFLIGCKQGDTSEVAVDSAISQEEASIGADGVNNNLDDLDNLGDLDQELEEDLLADLDDVELE